MRRRGFLAGLIGMIAAPFVAKTVATVATCGGDCDPTDPGACTCAPPSPIPTTEPTFQVGDIITIQYPISTEPISALNPVTRCPTGRAQLFLVTDVSSRTTLRVAPMLPSADSSVLAKWCRSVDNMNYWRESMAERFGRDPEYWAMRYYEAAGRSGSDMPQFTSQRIGEMP